MVKTQNTDKMKVITYYDRPTCVFGAVDTPNGRAIADEMLAWITPEYNTHDVSLLMYMLKSSLCDIILILLPTLIGGFFI